MRTVFSNGPIWTGTPENPDWVVVDGPRISELGFGEPPSGEQFDLDGRCLLPGFQDAHVHTDVDGCDLHDIDPTEYLEVVARYASNNPDATWIVGGGWLLDSFDGGIARRELLDAVVPDRPVLLYSTDYHAAWVNTRALEIAGIDRFTPDPSHGRIKRDADGSPNGTLHEAATDFVQRLAPEATLTDIAAGIVTSQDYFLSLGITGWNDAHVRPIEHAAYLELVESGRLVGRVMGSLWWDRDRGEDQLDELLAISREGTERYRPTAIKLMVDGVIENGTGAMCAPYVGSDDRGIRFLDSATLNSVVPRIMAAGLQPHFHAIGDDAIRAALDSVEAGSRSDAVEVRPHIAHIHVIDPVDIPRFGSLGVAANAQALWACHDDTMRDLTIPRLGQERSAWQYPFRSLVDAGAHLAAGSDWSVSTADPFAQMAVAVSRSTAEAPEPFFPEQVLTRAEAVRAFTSGSAWVNHDEDRAGTIEVGKDADLVVASDDPLADVDLATVRTEVTFVSGKVVYQR